MTPSWVLFFQIVSPLLVLCGVAFQVIRLCILRSRQQRAIVSLCDEIMLTCQMTRANALRFRLLLLDEKAKFYNRILFENRTPLLLIDEVLTLQAILRETSSVGEPFCQRLALVEIGSAAAVPNPLAPIIERALELKGKSRFVLFCL